MARRPEKFRKGKLVTKNTSSRVIYPNPSKPGEPPRLRTGFGRTNIIHEVDADGLRGRVGIRGNALYMLFHELGVHGQRRPWLMTTLQKKRSELAAAAMAVAKR